MSLDNVEPRVQKAVLADSFEYGGLIGWRPEGNKHARGINIYNLSELQGVSGRSESGRIIPGTIQRPLFLLSVNDRIEIFKRSSMLQGVVTSRAKRVSALNWKITRKDREYDNLIHEVKEAKEIFDEFTDQDIKSYTVRYMAHQKITSNIPGVKDDLSNFDSALRRYRKQIMRSNENKATEIEAWIDQPSMGVSFADFRHAYVIDLMIHGGASMYKQYAEDRMDNFYLLPGGTIFPYRQMHIGGPEIYFQIIPTFEPKAYFANEVSYVRYIPVSWQTLGELPLEALVNKIAESILFDKRAADQADGTKPPEKAVAFGKSPSPMGGLTDDLFELPMDKAEQKRIETKLNEARREAIVTISGLGHPAVIDLSKSDTFGAQQTRQDKLLRDVALIYNMTNMEVNLAGGEFTSGKETSDVQKEIEQEKGIGPIVKAFEHFMNNDILPFRYGYEYKFEFDVGLSEQEQVELEQQKMGTGTYSANEIREDRGDDSWPEDEYNRPKENAAATPDGSTANPLNIAGMVDAR